MGMQCAIFLPSTTKSQPTRHGLAPQGIPATGIGRDPHCAQRAHASCLCIHVEPNDASDNTHAIG